MSLLTLLISAIRRQTSKDSPAEEIRKSIARQAKLSATVTKLLPYFRLSLLGAGFIYFLLLSSKRLGREHHVSENALQPAQVRTEQAYKRNQIIYGISLGQYVLELGRCTRSRWICY